MSNLVYQNYNSKCRGWTSPSSLLNGPKIIDLSSYQSPAGSNTLVSINGENFYSYSRVAFGTFNPTPYFINTNIIQFYVPNTLSSGTFPVQVFNGSIASNSVNFTIDNSSGYWFKNPYGTITNSNTGVSSMVQVQSLSRGVPVTIDTSVTSYVVPLNVTWIICTSSSDSSVLITLPYGPAFSGRELTFRINTSSMVTINCANGISINKNGTISNTILVGSLGNWVTIVYDGGSQWYVMQNN